MPWRLIWKKQYSLAEIVASDQFKDYDALKKRLDYVLGNKGTPRFQDQESVQEEEEFRAANRGTPVPQSMKEELDALSSSSGGFNDPDITPSSNDDDDALSYFAKLVSELLW